MKIINKKIVINLSSSRVSAGLVYYDENIEKVVVESFWEEKIDYSKHNLAKFQENTIKALDKICIELISKSDLFNANFILDNIVVFLSQPWVEYENYNLKDESFDNFELSESYLKNFFFQNNTYVNKELIRSDVLSVKLNDYFVSESNLKGKRVKKIEANFLDSYITAQHKRFISDIINVHFPLLKIEFFPFLPTLFSSIETLYGLDQDFLFIDFTAEILEAGIFIDKKIESIASFPIGKNNLISSIMKQSKIDFTEAESLFNMYLTDSLSDNEFKQVDKIFQDFSKQISDKIETKLLNVDKYYRNVYAVNASLENRLILKKIAVFSNIIFIDKNILSDLVVFKDIKIWDNFFALESKYIVFR